MKSTSLVFLAALVLGATASLQAQTVSPPGRQHINSQVARACKSDIQQMCRGQTGQQAEECLINNESKLSSQCKGALSPAPQQGGVCCERGPLRAVTITFLSPDQRRGNLVQLFEDGPR